MTGAVERDGEPVLTRGPSRGSVKQPNEAHGVDWLGFFNSQLSQPPFSGHHNGSEIVVECWPEDEPQLIDKVDAAIDSANQRLRDMYS